LPYVASTLAKATTPSTEYLEAPDACEVLAACDVVARLRGQIGQKDAYTEEVDAWVTSQAVHPDPQLIASAVAALDRVLGENSELAELWDESDEGQAWRLSVQALRQRLTT
ncbi:MAG: DUF4259 domain-containing protein, partial [Myxococcales bacterium]|nr:DUF4259 domain-containing protein [Myxococcales bacterium]